jgi:hypothetical protein
MLLDIGLTEYDHHSYGANLRAYYKEWKRQEAKPSFWEWLDDETVEVEGVPRTKLERETVLYCDTDAERQKFALTIRNGLVYHEESQEIVQSGDDGWIFVLRDGILFGSQKETKKIPRIHHTSFVAGECVQTAGMMVINDGVIHTIYPHSGHYRPSEHELLVLLRFLVAQGVDLSEIQVDVQRIQKVFRDTINGALVKKIDNAHFWNAFDVLHFLEEKHLAWKIGMFDELVDTVVRKNYVGLEVGDLADEAMVDECDTTADFTFETAGSGDNNVGGGSHPSTFERSCDTIFEDPLDLLATCELQH